MNLSERYCMLSEAQQAKIYADQLTYGPLGVPDTKRMRIKSSSEDGIYPSLPQFKNFVRVLGDGRKVWVVAWSKSVNSKVISTCEALDIDHCQAVIYFKDGGGLINSVECGVVVPAMRLADLIAHAFPERLNKRRDSIYSDDDH